MTEKELLIEIERAYYDSAEHEGDDYKHLSMRNDDIEFLIMLSKRALKIEE